MSSRAGAYRFKSALKKLCQHGEEALKPQRMPNNRWRKPAISRREAAYIRKQALIAGTFGSFDASTGEGWDPNWDTIGKTGTMQIRPPKGTKRERTREARAIKIEGLLEGMDQKIEEYYKAKQDKKPEKSFENTYKKLMLVKKK